MANLDYTICAECGIEFGAPAHFISARRKDGNSFYCPNGHSLSFGDGETEKLRRERDRLKQRLAQKDDAIAHERQQTAAAERREAAQRGQVTKLKNRTKAGVCPCCSRTFQNLQRHMSTKHPKFSGDEAPKLTVVS